MFSALHCSICGREIPSGFENLPCPTCAFQQALRAAVPAPVAGEEPRSTRPMRGRGRPKAAERSDNDVVVPEPDGGSSGSGMPPRRRNHTYWRYRRWSVAVFIAALAVYGVARLGWIHTHIEEIVRAHGDNAAAWYLAQYPSVRLAPGAQIIRVNELSFNPATAPDTILTAMEAPELRIEVVESGPPREVVVPSIVWNSQWARLVVGLAVGALGALAFALRPGGRSATGFAAFCVFVAALWVVRAVPFFQRTAIESAAYDLTRLYLPVAGLVFALTFTSLRGVVRRISVPLAIVAGACTVLLVLRVLILYFGALSPSIWFRYLFPAWAILLLGTMALLLPYKVWNRLGGSEPNPTDRQRAWVVRLAVLLSFAPALVYTIILWAVGRPYNLSVANELIVLIFPAMMCYAIFRHNLLSINDLLLEGALYGLGLFVLLLGYGAAMAAGASLLPQYGEWVRAGFIGAAAVVIVPLHGRVRTTIDRKLDRVEFNYDALTDLIDDLVPQSLTAEDFCRRAAQIIGRSAQTSEVNIILRRPGQRGLTITGISPLPNSEQVVANCQTLIEDLEAHESGYSIDDLLDEWSHDRRTNSSLNALRDFHASFVVPLSSHRQFIGALLIGARVDFRNYTLGEMKTFRRLARHLAADVLQILNRSAAITGRRIADIYPAYPERIGRYVIERILGEGGMAYVYRGKSADRWAAIKVCNRFVQAHSDLMERFHREGIAMQRLDHPNIVQVLEVGWEGPEPFIATEYLPGGSLEDLVRAEGPLDEKRALRFVVDVARGLEAAQKNGIIHRDIKPRNLFVTEDDRIKIGDFGLAQIADATTLTQAGEIFGTPHYMAPEVLDGEPADWRADQYALGIALFYMVTNRHPFTSEDREVLHRLYAREELPAPSLFNPTVSDGLCAILKKLTQKSREDRYGSYADIVSAVRT